MDLLAVKRLRFRSFYGRGRGVGRGLAGGLDRGVGVGRGVEVGVVLAVAVGVAVAVLFFIRLILLGVIGDQIGERKSIVSGDKIYAGPWLASAAIKKIGGARDTRGEIGNLAFIAFPI